MFLQVESLGTDYYVMTYVTSTPQLVVVATQDNTQVNITLPCCLLNNNVFSIVVGKGKNAITYTNSGTIPITLNR
jgi:hypothetical protein